MQNNCDIIHETAIKDIVDLITDGLKASKDVSWITQKNKSVGSIASVSSNLTLVFPVMVSRSLNIQNASMITKAIERKCVSMLQMLFSAFTVSDVDNAVDFISKFHTNIRVKDHMSIDDYVEFADSVTKFVESSEMVTITDLKALQMFKEDAKNLNFYIEDIISEHSINSYKVNQKRSKYEASVVLEDDGDLNERKFKLDQDKFNAQIIKTKHDIKDDNKNFNLKQTDSMYKNASTSLKMSKDAQDITRGQILDSDIKKSNELIPTSMVIRFVSTAGETPIVVDNAVIGVKAKLYPVDSTDIINRVSAKYVDKNWFKQVVRATTREISFWKDFVLAIDKAKIDAISSSRRGSTSKMWKVLERRSTKSRLGKWKSKSNDASPITTLVISEDEVEYLKKSVNINIENENVANSIMQSYNLMCLCIVDEAAETASFLFDTGDDMFETLSFNSLEREGTDNTYKKVINLMTKLSR